MARRLDDFDGGSGGRRRYPWSEWQDGSAWEILRGEDYDVPTPNMQTNLHIRADATGTKVRTRKIVTDDGVEGVVFQFTATDATPAPAAQSEPDDVARDVPGGVDVAEVEDVAALIDRLYADAVEIYERARREVMIPRSDGGEQRYAANRYKQQIDAAYRDNALVPAIAKIVRRTTTGFDHLGNAGRPDLMVETLVADDRRPYHHLFSAETIRIARQRLDDYNASTAG